MKKNLALRVSAISIAINLLLSVVKLIAGLIGGSAAMVSDAVHSASDVFTTVIVIIGISASKKKADSSHQYGHERMESIATLVLAAVLLATGVGIGYSAVRNIFGNNTDLKIPTMLPLIVAILSIAAKEWMFWYTRAAAKKLNSSAMMADAWHQRSDSLSSVGSFIGILGARLGFPVLDSVASLVICLFVVKVACNVFRDTIAKLTDRSCDSETEQKIREIILAQEGVLGLDDLKTRLFGSRIYIDVEISADGEQTLVTTHGIAERVHDSIEDALPNVKHCMVHVNPAGEEKAGN